MLHEQNPPHVAPTFDLPLDFQQLVDPTEILDELRTQSPVWQLRSESGMQAWLITRYRDVRSLLRDPRMSSDPETGAADIKARNAVTISGFFKVLHRSIVAIDPPDHGRLRRVVSPCFIKPEATARRAEVAETAHRLMDSMLGVQTVDLVPSFSDPLPILVLCDVLGISHEHHEALLRWGDEITTVPLTEAIRLKADESADELRQFMRRQLEAAEDHGHGMLGRLCEARARGEIDAYEQESMATSMILAGQETTKGALASVLHALLAHPERLSELRESPELISSAVDELVRSVGSPALAVHRYALEDIEVAGHVIPKGEQVFFDLHSANHDQDAFDHADVLDLRRSPNPHVGFGDGRHVCIGQHLARVEIGEALRVLLERTSSLDLACAPDEVKCRNTLARSLATLPVHIEVAPRGGHAVAA